MPVARRPAHVARRSRGDRPTWPAGREATGLRGPPVARWPAYVARLPRNRESGCDVAYSRRLRSGLPSSRPASTSCRPGMGRPPPTGAGWRAGREATGLRGPVASQPGIRGL